MRMYTLLLVILLASCGQNTGNNNSGSSSSEDIPLVRKVVNPKPVASYHVPMGDPRLDRKFGVDVYETPNTFQFRLEMEFDAMTQSDMLTVPNVGTWPVIEVHPGPDKLSCIIGFVDNNKKFREYKLLSGENNQLKLTVLKSYSVGKE